MDHSFRKDFGPDFDFYSSKILGSLPVGSCYHLIPLESWSLLTPEQLRPGRLPGIGVKDKVVAVHTPALPRVPFGRGVRGWGGGERLR